MATEYIRRDSVCLNKHVFYHPKDGIARNNGYDPADWAIRISDVMDVPAADVAPVKRGKWVFKHHRMMGKTPCCTECGKFEPIIRNFCPNCGADMREG